MYRSVRLFGFSYTCAFWVLIFSGCIRHVRLPQASPYPSSSSLQQGQQTEHAKKIVAQLRRSSPMLWKQLSLAWGIQRPYGRVFFRLTLRGGLLESCVLRRSDVHASLMSNKVEKVILKRYVRHLRRMFFRRYKALPMRHGICAYLRKKKWLMYKRSQPIVVNYVMIRKK